RISTRITFGTREKIGLLESNSSESRFFTQLSTCGLLREFISLNVPPWKCPETLVGVVLAPNQQNAPGGPMVNLNIDDHLKRGFTDCLNKRRGGLVDIEELLVFLAIALEEPGLSPARQLNGEMLPGEIVSDHNPSRINKISPYSIKTKIFTHDLSSPSLVLDTACCNVSR